MEFTSLKESQQLDVIAEFMYSKLNEDDLKAVAIKSFRDTLDNVAEETDEEHEAFIASITEEFLALTDKQKEEILKNYN